MAFAYYQHKESKMEGRIEHFVDLVSNRDLFVIKDLLVGANLDNATIFLFGNGGSFSNAMHFAEDLLKFNIRTHVLGSSTPMLTALSNDHSYQEAPLIELRSMIKERDLVILFSTSGDSENIYRLGGYLNKYSDTFSHFAFLGSNGGGVGKLLTNKLVIPSKDTALVEDVHMFLCHTVISEMENDYGVF